MQGSSINSKKTYIPREDSTQWRDRVVVDLSSDLRADVCIIGAGVAGSALAASLGIKGFSTVLIERDYDEPDKFIGELLQPGGVKMLQDLGLSAVLEGIDAQEVSGYALFNRDDHFSIEYPSVENNMATGRGFRYGKFVSSLRRAASQYEEVTMVEATAKGLLKDIHGNVSGVEIMLGDRTTARVHAGITVVANGAFSRLRTEVTDSEHNITSFMVGLLLKDCELPYRGHGHVFMTESSPFLLYPVSTSEARVLIDFTGTRSPKTSGRLTSRFKEVEDHLPEQLKEPFRQAAEDPMIKAMPGHLLAAKPSHGSGVIVLGDALNMRHPLTGGGMTVALSDVHFLVQRLSGPDTLKDHRAVVNQFYQLRHGIDGSINILADALYAVMTDPKLALACFEYLKQGQSYSNGPVKILSGVSRDTTLLLRKFVAVAAYAARRDMTPFNGFGSLRDAHETLTRAANIVRPLIYNEKPSMLTRTLLASSEIVLPKRSSPVAQ